MTAAIHEFKSISLKLNRMEQKAEFEARNQKLEPVSPIWSAVLDDAMRDRSHQRDS